MPPRRGLRRLFGAAGWADAADAPGPTMTARARLLLLILIMAAGSLTVAGSAIFILHGVAVDEEREELYDMVQSEARLIEAVSWAGPVSSRHMVDRSTAAMIAKIVEAHRAYEAFGDTGEFLLARREGDRIVYLLRHRSVRVETPGPEDFTSALAEPMRRALLGQSGTMVGRDYRGARVLAAYEPVGVMNLGLVAKIDLAEVRAPFVRAALLTVGITLFVVFAGAALFVRVTNPMIQGLRDHSARLEGTQQVLTRSLREKDVLLREIHHRVKNNMQVVSSLLNLQARGITDRASREVFQESQSRVRAMALIHEILYSSEDLSRIDLPRYLRALATSLAEMYGDGSDRIRVTVDVGEIKLGMDETVPCGLAIHELLANSYKHAFPNGRPGEIRIEGAQAADGRVTLVVRDDGVGMGPEADVAASHTMGLQLVRGLIENQLGGDVRVTHEGGACFHLSFPVASQDWEDG